VAEHLAGGAELFAAGEAIGARLAGHEVVETHPVAYAGGGYLLANLNHLARHLVAEGEGERFDARASGAIVHVGVADAGCADAHKYVTGAARRHRDVGIFNGVP
jgi:hypothetical protein